MTLRVAINGFGRIGRHILRSQIEAGRQDVQVALINDLADPATNAHLLRYDSVHGRFPGAVTPTNTGFDAGQGPIRVTAERDPRKLPLKEEGIDLVLECTGLFTDRDQAAVHLETGARGVLVSAPSKGADATIVYGVNHDTLTAEHKVVSNGSCTTNCLAPIASVLHKTVGIEAGFMTTIHAYTGDQPTLDRQHKDWRRARAAGLSMIPTSTGAAKAIGLVLPELEGKLDGSSIRVPVPNVSCVDLTFTASRRTSAEEVNAALVQAASEGPLKGVLGLDEEDLVSSDWNHSPFSSIVALKETRVMGGTFVRILSWYDNEWGFSNRMNDVAVLMGRVLSGG